MRILDRYILKSIVVTFISCIFVFLFMYVIIDVLSRLEDILKNQIHYTLLIQFYLTNLPIMFVQVAPFACLLSTLYTFSKLNHDNEVIAMRASGLSIFYITKTVIILGIIISLFVFWINDRFAPGAMLEIQKIQAKMDEGKKDKKEKKKESLINLSMYGLKNRLFFIDRFYPATATMDGVIILEQDEKQNLTRKIVANKGVYEDGLWRFYQSITYDFDHNGQIVGEPLYLEEEIMNIPETPQDFLAQRQRPENMTIAQLDNYIWKLSKSGATTVIRNLKLDLYQKFASPFSSLIIILLGIPFSLMIQKRATGLSSIGIAIIVGFLYYIFDAVCIALGRGGMLPPIIAVSSTHIVALAFSVYLISHLP
ncbi:MAG: LptF/LptG family permease [Candidatus Omnitrophica bacterium]|nr:LptF/LptG family permease [Candidatus Omnitrophota bacterium]MDD5662409.1 LptF/LptG family permease [Candidatus Omnitrophota bacterium]